MSLDHSDVDHRLDVRKINGPPFDAIVAALDELPEGESLLLVNSFEPRPLYQVIEDKGLSFETNNPEPDLWHVKITHTQ